MLLSDGADKFTKSKAKMLVSETQLIVISKKGDKMNLARQSHQLRRRLERKYMRKAVKNHSLGRPEFEEQFNFDQSDRKDYMRYKQIPIHR